MAGLGEGVPRDMKPVGAGEELIGEVVTAEKVDKMLKLSRVFRADVGSLADEVLGITDTADFAIDSLGAEARVNDDWPHNLAGRL